MACGKADSRRQMENEETMWVKGEREDKGKGENEEV